MPVEGMTLLQDSEEVLQELNKQKPSGAMPRIFNVDVMKAHFKKFAGVNIISLRVNREDDRMKAYINLYVEDLRQSLRQGLLPYTSLEKAGDQYVFAALYPFNIKKLKKNVAMLKAAKQLEVSFKVKTPSLITATNAHKNIANLAEWNFSSKGKSFAETDGRFTVRFDATKLTFLDDKKE